jgi:hypothetical protein
MTSNDGGLKITAQGKFPGYKLWVWFSKKAITNIIYLKGLIKIFRVTYDSKVEMTFVVYYQQFGLPDLFFEMHLCGLHICYLKKMGEFKDNIKFSAGGRLLVLLKQRICSKR